MYPVDFEIAEPERQNRWTVAFRAILVIPALFLSSAIGGGSAAVCRASGKLESLVGAEHSQLAKQNTTAPLTPIRIQQESIVAACCLRPHVEGNPALVRCGWGWQDQSAPGRAR